MNTQNLKHSTTIAARGTTTRNEKTAAKREVTGALKKHLRTRALIWALFSVVTLAATCPATFAQNCAIAFNFTTVASVSGYNGFPQGALFVNTDDNGEGKLVVGLRDINGNLHQADFQVVVFKTR